MFLRLKNIDGLRLRGSDGDVGRLEDLVVDDRWVVRYMVVGSSVWLGRAVLVSPMAITGIEWADARLDTTLTREQVRSSPDLLATAPLTRSAEAAYSSYYGFPAYWGGPGLWAWAGSPGALGGVPPAGYVPPAAGNESAPLRRVETFKGRHLAARDGPIGHVDDAIAEDEGWTLPFLLVDTSDWIGGRHVLVPTSAVRNEDGSARELALELTTEQVRSSPEYDRSRPIDSSFVARLRAHYGGGLQARPAPERATSASR